MTVSFFNFTFKKFIGIILIILIIVGAWNALKPLPRNVNIEGSRILISEDNIALLYDATYIDQANKRTSDQEIFDKVIEMIHDAHDYILIDMFLFGSSKDAHRHLALELSQNLIEKKKTSPNIKINFITDKYNTMYTSNDSVPEFKTLKEAGINIIFTDMDRLRDSNPIYSSFWRLFIRWFGESDNGWIKNPISSSPAKVSLRSIFKLLNFKANHRKVIIADYKGKEMSALVTSANPHDPSSAHSNIALYFRSKNWEDIYRGEKEIADFSKGNFLEIDKKYFIDDAKEITSSSPLLELQYETEEKIKKLLIQDINNAKQGDEILIAMFYLSERNIVLSLLDATKKGVLVRLILDPNKDAFGIEKNGIPNRQTAHELVKKSNGKIKIRWYDTHGEQFHTKMLLINTSEKQSILHLGSANFTRRNISNLNLEANIRLAGKKSSKPFIEANTIFSTLWENKKNNTYTVDFEKYKDTSFFKKLIYRFQEFSGMSTF